MFFESIFPMSPYCYSGGALFFPMLANKGCQGKKSVSRCQFHQRFLYTFFVRKSFLAAFSSYVLALAPKFHMKNACVYIDEIDTSMAAFLQNNVLLN
jgi:hypothetical protein